MTEKDKFYRFIPENIVFAVGASILTLGLVAPILDEVEPIHTTTIENPLQAYIPEDLDYLPANVAVTVK